MSDATRTCVVCRRTLALDEALRFVLGPDGEAVIDWRRKLPGRGASVCWSRPCLEGAGRPGTLARSFRQRVEVAGGEWPLDSARQYLAHRQREWLGLAGRTGQLKSGSNLVQTSLKSKRRFSFLVRSQDMGPTVGEEWERRAESKELPLLESLLDSVEMGAALGKNKPRSIAAVADGQAARALRQALNRGHALL